MAFLVTVVPSILALAAVTIYSTRSLVAANRRLAEISLSLEAIRGLHLSLSRASAILKEDLLTGRADKQEAFTASLDSVDKKLATCASVTCHEASPPLTPRKMAAMVAHTAQGLKEEGALVFDAAPSGGEADRSRRLANLDGLMRATDRRLWLMSGTLAARVETLREKAQTMGRRTLGLAILLAAVVALLGSGVAVAFGTYVSLPIRELLIGVRQVTAGDRKYRVKARGWGEVDELAGAFNAMVDELERRREEIAEYNRTLEERVRLRTEELRKKDEALAQSQKLASLGMLASGVAHELNNPLTSIMMKTKLMIEEVGETSSFYHELEKIDENAIRCKRVIDDLRGLLPRSEVHKTPCQVSAVVAEALNLVRHEFERRRIQVVCEVPGALPRVLWDPERVVRVFTNLFMNAVEAIGEDGRVVVRASVQNGWLKMEVSDTGVGMPHENLSRIFDPFFTTKSHGTGLGLSLSHGIVREHGGRIEIESRTAEMAGAGERSGTIVRIFFPLPEAGS